MPAESSGALRRFFLYTAATLVPVLGLGVVLSVMYTRQVDEGSRQDGIALATVIGNSGVEPFLEGHSLTEGLNARERYSLMMSTGDLVADGTVLRLRVRDTNGQVMFDAAHPTAPPGEAIIDAEVIAAAAGTPVVEMTSPGADPVDGGVGDDTEAIEVYLALTAPSSPDAAVGVLEVYLPFAPIAAAREDSLRQMQITITVGLFVLWLLLAVIMWRVTRRIHRQSEFHEHLALHDSLTGLPNRALYADRVNQALATARRSGSDVAMAVVDLDRFKEVNDTLGHQNGDEFLRMIAQRMLAAIRPGDTLARLGGDEFGLVLPGVDETTVGEVLQRVQDALGEELELAGVPLSAEASIGYALWPADAEDTDTLLQRADLALYAAKEARAAIVRYHEGIDEFDPQRLGLVAELKRAIAAGDLVLHYQPKIDAETGQVIAFEALVRWMHPVKGMLPPLEFIPIAESTGLIAPLTHWVIDAALAQLAEWSVTTPGLSMAVNISARNLREEQLLSWVFDRLETYGIEPGRLILELTETSFATDPVRATALLEALSAGGVKVSLDDFGQGYTSLGSLGHLPVSELKIDRGFVFAMQASPEDRAIVASVIELGHQLGLTVVAEGVETTAMYDDLRRLGCDTVQGYLFSPPVPADRAMALVRPLLQPVI
jgi:diguanylate cyclase